MNEACTHESTESSALVLIPRDVIRLHRPVRDEATVLLVPIQGGDAIDGHAQQTQHLVVVLFTQIICAKDVHRIGPWGGIRVDGAARTDCQTAAQRLVGCLHGNWVTPGADGIQVRSPLRVTTLQGNNMQQQRKEGVNCRGVAPMYSEWRGGGVAGGLHVMHVFVRRDNVACWTILAHQ